jgi:hypothetical protein
MDGGSHWATVFEPELPARRFLQGSKCRAQAHRPNGSVAGLRRPTMQGWVNL